MKPVLMVDGVEYVRRDSLNRAAGQVWKVGAAYAIRTVTMIVHGTVVEVGEHELVLARAAWIADTGRFADFISGHKPPAEVEPFPPEREVIVGRGSVVDACELPGHFDKQV